MGIESGLDRRQGEASAAAGVVKAAGLIAAHVMQVALEVDLEECPAVVPQNMHQQGDLSHNFEFELHFTLLTHTSNFLFAQ